MKPQDYNCTLIVSNTPGEVCRAIYHVSGWWTINTEGRSEQLNDIFTVRFGETWVRFKIVELVPDAKIVWLVTDCFLHWLTNKTEWKETKLIFEISASETGTKMSFTHLGIAPGIECYNDCKKGWDFFAGNSLHKLITENKGMPDRTKQTQ